MNISPNPKKILFCTDCTDLYAGSDYAFASALDLSERSGAELIIFHALESRHRYSGQVITEDGETWESQKIYEKLQEKLQDYYYCRIAPVKLKDVRIAVKGGVPKENIKGKAEIFHEISTVHASTGIGFFVDFGSPFTQ